MFKVDYFRNGLLVPIIEYEIYDYNEGKILNLTFCKNIPIIVRTPLLSGKKEEICVNLCDDNCKYLEYDSNYGQYICQCSIKNNMNLISNIEVQKWNAIGYYDKFCQIKNSDNDNNDLNSKDEIINIIKAQIKNGTLDKLIKELLYEDGEDIIINKKDAVYQITSFDNQYFDEYLNISTINLGECEDKLRFVYNISYFVPLFIFKVDYFIEGSTSSIVEYEVYEPESNKPLNLSYCKEIKLDIVIPVLINDSLFEYHASSEYYKDLCYIFTTDKGTDVPLKVRKNEIINNNFSVCENNCTLKGYDSTSKKALCECGSKMSISLPSEIYNIKDKDKLVETFRDLKKFNLFKCARLFFSKQGLKNNIGSYIILVIIWLNIILMLVMIKQGKSLIQNEINKILKVNFETNDADNNNNYSNNNEQNRNNDDNNEQNNNNSNNNNKNV